MKFFLSSLLILGCVSATVLGLTLAGKPLPRVAKPVGGESAGQGNVEVLDTNNLGQLVITLIHNILADLGDPLLVINETLTVPLYLQDVITISGEVNVSNVQIEGISTLNITDSIATIIPIGGTFGFHLPEIVVTGEYATEILVTSFFPLPLQGEGTFRLRITETILNTIIKLKALLNGHLAVNSIAYDVSVYDIGIRIEGLFNDLDDGQLNEAANVVLNAYLTQLFNMFEAQLHEDVIELVTVVADEILGELTLADIIDLINSGGKTTTTPAPRPLKLNDVNAQ